MATRKTKKKTRAKATSTAPARRSAPKRASAKKKTTAGFRLTSSAASLTVNDVAVSMDWYCKILGFTVGERWERDGVLTGAELQAGGATVYIGQDDWQKGRDRVKGEGFRLYWTTTQNIDQLAAGIKARGGTLASEPKDEWGVRSFNLVDPTGFKITVSSDR